MAINKVFLIGRLGKDPETKVTASGESVTRFSIATSEKWTDKSGEKQERTEWHNIVTWGKLATSCAKFISKGSQVYVEGKLQTRSWENNAGATMHSTDVVAATVQFLDPPDFPRTRREADTEPAFDPDEEIPF